MDSTQYRSRWPKPLPVLTEEQRRIREDFMEHWQEVRPNRFGLVERFNQQYPPTDVYPWS